jgi:peptidyl-prolyl cis-trans isomerase A (cyclophilin A)
MITRRFKWISLAFTLALFAAPAFAQSALENPAGLREQAPATYKARFDTTKGVFVIEVTRAWAPRGADRFHELVQANFYDGARFFRVVPRFVVQFGLKGVPATDRHWSQMTIPDDPVTQNNARGTITFAKAGPASRTTQVFINLQDNFALDKQGFPPFGKVISGMDVVDQLYKVYGDGPPSGVGPEQGRIRTEGNEYLDRYFARLDSIKKAAIE